MPFVLNSELSAEERLSATVSFRYRDDAFTEISVVDNPYINGQEVSTIFHIVVDQDKLSTNNSKMVIDVHFTCYIEADHRTV
ncbi:MAG: hypothetical protein MJ233_02685 [Mycoplasmoidaceae bacterium]|nr:hypothetical protein [Mycoplasmoidaceae bacterium]